MFGYIIPDKMNMYIKDFTIFRAYYCGLCKALGKTGCQMSRFATNYDSTFLNVLCHTLTDTDIKIKNEACVLAPLKKKSIVCADELTFRVADVTILLVYYNLIDDVIDGENLKRIPKIALWNRARKAKKREPEICKKIEKSYKDLRTIEKEGTDSIDKASHPFSQVICDIVENLVPGLDEISKRFCYNLGKLVYLFDAIDDVEKDTKSKTFNPFVSAYGKAKSKIEFLNLHKTNIDFCLNVCYNQLVDDYNNMNVSVSEGVLSNIVYLGIKMQLDKLLQGENKCAKIRL